MTQNEHMGLHNAEGVSEGLIGYKIAAHAADIACHRPGACGYHDKTLPAAIYKHSGERLEV